MRYLLIDTSTERGLVAWMEDDNILGAKFLPKGLQNSKYLFPYLEEMKPDLTSLDFIAVGIGPGSYTGIRVGVMTGKSLAFGAKIPVVGVSSLIGFVPQEDQPFTAIIDAKIGGAYVLEGVKKDGKVEFSGVPSVKPLEEISTKHILITPNKTVLEKKITGAQLEERDPCISTLAQEAQANFKNKLFDFDLLYLRKTQAEIEKEAAGN
jgi:tRNA threonylcarbamoyladenosine biosynthesis protein TsaB